MLGRGYSYTPKILIDGKREAVGPNRSNVFAEIKATKAEPKLAVIPDRAGTIAISVDGPEENSTAICVVT